MAAWIEEKEDGIVIRVRAIPRAPNDAVVGVLNGQALKVRIQAPPVEGKANACLVKFLARHWRIPRADIVILSGDTGRNKRLMILHPPKELKKELLSIKSC